MKKKVLALSWWLCFAVGSVNTVYLVGLLVVTMQHFGQSTMPDDLIVRYLVVITIYAVALGVDKLIRRAGYDPLSKAIKAKP